MGAARRRPRDRRRRWPAPTCVSTTRVLAGGPAGQSSTTWCSPAPTRPTAAPASCRPGVAALLGLPYLSYAAKIEPDPGAGTVRVNRISPTGFDVLEAPMPALIVCTQALGEPRYPSLKGIMAARSKAGRSDGRWPTAASVGDGPSAARPRPPRSSGPRRRRPRAATRVVRDAPDEAARQVVDVPRRAEDHLMAGAIWVHGETDRRTAGSPSISAEVATLARALGEAAGRERRRGRRRGRSGGARPRSSRGIVPRVLAVTEPATRRPRRRRRSSAERLAALIERAPAGVPLRRRGAGGPRRRRASCPR